MQPTMHVLLCCIDINLTQCQKIHAYTEQRPAKSENAHMSPPPPHSPNTQADRKLPTDQFVVSPVLVEAQQCTTQCGVVVLPGAVGSPAASFVQLILTVEVAILVNFQDG